MKLLSFRSHRPLSDALDRIQQILLKPINFEEAPYRSSQDVGSSSVRTTSGRKAFQFPIGGFFELTLPQRDSDASSATQSVLSAYHGTRLSSASYRAAQKSYGVAVFPTQALAPEGSMAAVTPVMEQDVSFSTAIRSVAETIALFQETLSQTAGVRILPANMPIPPAHATVEFGANNEPAGSVLLGLFAKLSSTPMSYRLLFDPNSQAYYLSICSFPYAFAKPVPRSPAPRNLAPKSPPPTVPGS